MDDNFKLGERVFATKDIALTSKHIIPAGTCGTVDFRHALTHVRVQFENRKDSVWVGINELDYAGADAAAAQGEGDERGEGVWQIAYRQYFRRAKEFNLTPMYFTQYLAMHIQLELEANDVLRDELAEARQQLAAAREEMELRGEFLARIVTIREELIDERSNSWLDSIDVVRDRLHTLTIALMLIADRTDVDKPVRLAGEDAESYGQTLGLWKAGSIARKALAKKTEAQS